MQFAGFRFAFESDEPSYSEEIVAPITVVALSDGPEGLLMQHEVRVVMPQVCDDTKTIGQLKRELLAGTVSALRLALDAIEGKDWDEIMAMNEQIIVKHIEQNHIDIENAAHTTLTSP